jgi:hypothetical protein
MFSTDDLLITEFKSKQECINVQVKFKNAIMKENKDVKAVNCEEGEIMDSYTLEENSENL